MDKLCQELKNTMEMRGIDQSDIVKNTGVSKATVSNLFSDDVEKRKEPKFNNMLKIIRFLDSDNFNDKIEMYMMFVTKPENIKSAIEYCSINKNKIFLSHMIEKAKDHPNESLNEWSKVHKLDMDYIKREDKKSSSFLEQLNRLNVSDSNLEIYVRVLKSQHNYYNQNYNIVKSFLLEAKSLLDESKNEFLKTSYSIRLDQILGYVHLKVNNDPELCRECANNLIDNSNIISYVAYGYYLKGLSFFYTDKEMAELNLTKSKEMYLNIGKTNFISDVNDKTMLLDYYWNNNLNSLTKSNEKSKALQLYIEGVKHGCKKTLYFSLSEFVKSGDAFFSNLPMRKLVSQGEDKDVLTSIQNINIA